MPQGPSKKGVVNVEIPADLKKAVGAIKNELGTTLQNLYAEAMQDFVLRYQSGAKDVGYREDPALRLILPPGGSVAAPAVAPAESGSRSPKYRPVNLPWHDRLELVLNDPEEALGIQKNLEWAEKTVRAKPTPRKRAVG